jgi:hypothetical protein
MDNQYCFCVHLLQNSRSDIWAPNGKSNSPAEANNWIYIVVSHWPPSLLEIKSNFRFALLAVPRNGKRTRKWTTNTHYYLSYVCWSSRRKRSNVSFSLSWKRNIMWRKNNINVFIESQMLSKQKYTYFLENLQKFSASSSYFLSHAVLSVIYIHTLPSVCWLVLTMSCLK